MFERVKNYISRFAYSDETFNLLNYFTLGIKDHEITKMLDELRADKLNECFWPIITMWNLATIYFLFFASQEFTYLERSI